MKEIALLIDGERNYHYSIQVETDKDSQYIYLAMISHVDDLPLMRKCLNTSSLSKNHRLGEIESCISRKEGKVSGAFSYIVQNKINLFTFEYDTLSQALMKVHTYAIPFNKKLLKLRMFLWGRISIENNHKLLLTENGIILIYCLQHNWGKNYINIYKADVNNFALFESVYLGRNYLLKNHLLYHCHSYYDSGGLHLPFILNCFQKGDVEIRLEGEKVVVKKQ